MIECVSKRVASTDWVVKKELPNDVTVENAVLRRHQDVLINLTLLGEAAIEERELTARELRAAQGEWEHIYRMTRSAHSGPYEGRAEAATYG